MGRKRKPISEQQLLIVAARVKTDIFKEIKGIARESDCAMAVVVRRFIVEGLKQHRKRATA